MTIALPVLNHSNDYGGYLSPNGLPYLSVSQVDTALGPEGCELKWEIRYLAKVKPPPDGSAVLGSRVHAIAEDYLKFGTIPDLDERLTLWHKKKQRDITYAPGQIFAAEIPFLPERSRVKVEGLFKFSTNIHGGMPVYFQGAKDMEWFDDAGLVHIGDHKNTVSWQYMKKVDKLVRDWQGNLYAFEAMERLGVDRVGLDWFTNITDPEKRRECRPTRLEVTRSNARDIVAEIERQGRVLLSHYQEHMRSGKLPGLPKTGRQAAKPVCDAFGGCVYKDTEHCPAQTLEEMFSMTEPTNYNAFLNDVAKLHNLPSVPAVPPPPVHASIPAVPPPPPVFVPQSAPPPPPVAVAVKPWAPGAPMNETQLFLQTAGASLAMIANAADVPPTPEVAASYLLAEVNRTTPPEVAASYVTGKPVPGPFTAATAAMMQEVEGGSPLRPPVESGLINPPEARGMVAPLTPEELQAQVPANPASTSAPATTPVTDDLDLMSRDAVKALGVSLGAFGIDCRFQLPRMKDEVRKARAQDGKVIQRAGDVAPFAHGDAVYDGDKSLPPPPPIMAAASPADAQRPDDRHGQVALTTEEKGAIQVETVRLAESEQVEAMRKLETLPTPPALTELMQTPSVFGQGFTLYINCAPDGDQGLSFVDVLRAVLPRVRTLCEGDWRGGSKASDYGKGAIVLANAVHKYLTEYKVDMLVVDGRTPEALACMSVLTEMAGSIVRGF